MTTTPNPFAEKLQAAFIREGWIPLAAEGPIGDLPCPITPNVPCISGAGNTLIAIAETSKDEAFAWMKRNGFTAAIHTSVNRPLELRYFKAVAE